MAKHVMATSRRLSLTTGNIYTKRAREGRQNGEIVIINKCFEFLMCFTLKAGLTRLGKRGTGREVGLKLSSINRMSHTVMNPS